MGFLKQSANCRFSNKTILLFVLPIFLEQIMIAFIGIADTYMVADLGEAAVAGVSLATGIDKFVKSIFSGLAAGASVVVSQYIGADDKSSASKSMKTGIQILFVLTIIVSAVMVLFKKQILGLLFGAVEKDVMESSLKYFSVSAFSYPMVSLFNTGCSSYRAMGNSRVTFWASMVMLGINLILKYIFIRHMHLGVTGAGLSSLIAYGVVGIILIISLHSANNKVSLSRIHVFEGSKKMISSILGIGLPNGIENGMFQMGHILLQNLVSTLGTVSIAANALYSNLSPLYHSLNSGFSLGITTFVAQCMGSGKPDEARFYMRHILKLNYVFTAINGTIIIIFSKYLISIYGLSPEVTSVGHKLLLMYVAGAIFAYPSAFTYANALRGTGDTKFTMTVSLLSMFGVRIGLAYIAVKVFGMGIYGVQLVMVLEWFEKGIIYHIRERRGKWQNIKVI